MVSGRSLALWRLVGLDVGAVVRYCVGMPKSEVQRSVRQSAAITNAGNRMEMAEVKKLIHDSNVCALAIEMAQTGYRPVLDLETGEIVKEQMSEASHVEMIKFIVAKVIPNAKEQESTDDKQALDAWSKVIEAENAKELVAV